MLRFNVLLRFSDETEIPLKPARQQGINWPNVRQKTTHTEEVLFS